MDYPDACGQGRVWQSGTIVTRGDAKVQVAGSNSKALRGLRHGPHRPDLCVLDDIENDEQVRNPEQRDKLQSWLTKTVLPLGGAVGKFDVPPTPRSGRSRTRSRSPKKRACARCRSTARPGSTSPP